MVSSRAGLVAVRLATMSTRAGWAGMRSDVSKFVTISTRSVASGASVSQRNSASIDRRRSNSPDREGGISILSMESG